MMYFYSNKGKAIAALLLVLALFLTFWGGMRLERTHQEKIRMGDAYDEMIHTIINFNFLLGNANDRNLEPLQFSEFQEKFPGYANSIEEYRELSEKYTIKAPRSSIYLLGMEVGTDGSGYLLWLHADRKNGLTVQDVIPLPTGEDASWQEILEQFPYNK